MPLPEAPAAWITEEVTPVPKNIYGVTKAAAEDLCQLFHRNQGLACIVLRTSRFFPEHDDNKTVRETYSDENAKLNEYLFRRVDLEDVVSAHIEAAKRAPEIGFGRFIISATTPFSPGDLLDLRIDPLPVVRRLIPDYEAEYARRGWKMFPKIDCVYLNTRARTELLWRPRHDFRTKIDGLKTGAGVSSPLARIVGSKGYHGEVFDVGPFPVE